MSCSINLFEVPGLIKTTNIPLANLTLWLDASNANNLIITDGITKWNDISGNNNNAILLTSTKPQLVSNSLNNKNTIAFNNSALNIDNFSGLSINGDFQFYLVSKFNILDTNAAIFTAGTNTPTDEIVFMKNSSNQLFIRVNSAGGDAILDYNNTSWNILQSTHTTINRTIKTLTTENNNMANKNLETVNTFTIGGYRGSFYFLNGNIAEFIMYNRLLTSEESNLVLNYLTNKWNLN